ncbi:hypothetical protein NA56DRAFT_687726 [Hyaloscypha hepaticicola]|jgi:hypothetical protein|uniref:F-box domain-containing protein n=1 Tax=Hyaloscypha hepaticicola TaxID=2082293 RepID=A0A2J6QB35_9HELO|nr:hypothetical protein NA56DRAFT_687726 [Hyaloscypha hepaticicola]
MSSSSSSPSKKVESYQQIASLLHIETGDDAGSPHLDAAAASTTCFLLELAPELLTQIIGYLQPVESTCLGLTCKKFYPIHFSRHGKVALHHYVSVTGRLSQSSSYTRNGTTLANFLTAWVPSHLKYNYEKRKFVTEEEFERFIEEVREDEFQQISADAPMIFKDLDDGDYDDMVDRYMEEADDMGWEYEDRPIL